MKPWRFLTVPLFLIFPLSSALAACGRKELPSASETVLQTPEVKTEAELAAEAFLAQYEGAEETGTEQELLESEIRMSEDGLQTFLGYLSTCVPSYPYGEIIRLETAYKQYQSLDRRENARDFAMVSSLPISGEAMLEHVKANNEAFLSVSSIETSVLRPLEEDYLAWVCGVVADTLNRELAQTDFGDQLPSIDWNLQNLKILTGRTFANASYSSGALMQIRPSGADGMVGITGDEMAAHKTVTHEVEHLLQNMSAPEQEALGVSQNYGFSYQWEDLEVNSLYFTWFTEASAERLAAAFYGTEPATYKSMIGYLDSLTFPALLRGKQPAEVPRLSQQPYLETAFAFFDCQTEEEKREFLNLLYAIELIQVTPDDFLECYAAARGLEAGFGSDTELAALRKTLKTPVCLTMSRYFYRDLARLLAGDGMTLRELFYLMSMWEFDLSGHILYDDETRLADTEGFLTGYTALQDHFLQSLVLSSGLTEDELQTAFAGYLGRCEVPRRSILKGDETWNKGPRIAALSPEGNAFLDAFYETVSQNKTVPVRVAAAILLEP